MSAKYSFAYFVACILIVLPTSVVAQPTPAARATAEAMFEQGLTLMEQGQAAAACPKFEASQKLDPGVGTLLYLADCYETVGRTASAWATFLQASYAASAVGQEDRRQLAETNAERLKPTLSMLVLTVQDKDTPGLRIKQDTQELNSATWGTEVPVDPGEHTLSASAEGKEPWTAIFVVPSGPGVTRFEVPALKDSAQVPVAAAPLAAPPETAPVVAAPPAAPPTRSNPDDPGSSQRTWGWVAVGAGGAALLGSGLFTFLAVSDNGRADDLCRQDDPTRCGERGVELGESATNKATLATIFAGVGGAIAVTGFVLVLTAPDDDAQSGIRVGTSVAATSQRLTLGGWW